MHTIRLSGKRGLMEGGVRMGRKAGTLAVGSNGLPVPQEGKPAVKGERLGPYQVRTL